MRFDNKYRFGNSIWSLSAFGVVNISILLSALILYFINQFFLKKITGNILVHGYLNDLLAMNVLLPYCNVILKFYKLKDFRIIGFYQIVCFAIIVGVFWEVVTPVYHECTRDLLDIFAYIVGGFVYYLLMRIITMMNNKIN